MPDDAAVLFIIYGIAAHVTYNFHMSRIVMEPCAATLWASFFCHIQTLLSLIVKCHQTFLSVEEEAAVTSPSA